MKTSKKEKSAPADAQEASVRRLSAIIETLAPKPSTAAAAAAEQPGGERQPCPRVPPEPCVKPEHAPQPEAVVRFRQPIVLGEIPLFLGSEIEGQKVLRLGCHPFETDGVKVRLAIDVLYEQRWHFVQHLVGPLTNTLALAPGEELKITLRNSQRKYLDRLNVEQVEQSEQTESTIVDKDVLNVARASSRSANWSVSANGSFSVGPFSAGASASFSQSYNQSTTVTTDNVHENTVKSTENLKLLQKTEVREITETTQESTNARTIRNPYLDRSLGLNIYNMAKRYCVEFHAVGLRPVLLIEVIRLHFDRHFVLTNGAFLDEALLDSTLRFELAQALEVISEMRPPEATEKARARALMALDYLYSEPNIFNVPIPGVIGPPPPDPNLPETSFTFFDGGGLNDAVGNRLGVVFTTLGMFREIYLDQIKPLSDGELALDVAVTLQAALSPAWPLIEGESDIFKHVLDTSHYTEIFRRLGGFLTIVSGMVLPAVQPAEAEREAARAQSRAEFVIGRVIEHLNCYAPLYTRRFLEFIAAQSRMEAIFLFVRDLIQNHLQLPPAVKQALLDLLDIEGLFIDRNMIVVPGRRLLSPATAGGLNTAGTNAGRDGVRLGLLNVYEAIAPTDGVHIEPVPGQCVLEPATPWPPMRHHEDG